MRKWKPWPHRSKIRPRLPRSNTVGSSGIGLPTPFTNIMKTIPIIFCTLALLIVGCGQMDKLYNQRIVVTTNYVVTVTSNALGVTSVTNPVTVESVVLTEPKPIVIDTIDTGKRFLPMPYGDILAALAALIFGVYQSWRNKANQKTRDKVVGTLVENFEAAKAVVEAVAPAKKKELMKEVVHSQKVAGVQEEIKEHLPAS